LCTVAPVVTGVAKTWRCFSHIHAYCRLTLTTANFAYSLSAQTFWSVARRTVSGGAMDGRGAAARRSPERAESVADAEPFCTTAKTVTASSVGSAYARQP
jgi:hypothetical protein